MPLGGSAKICLYGTCGSFNNAANLTVPLSVIGQGGVATFMGAVNLTVVGGAWTTGTAAVGSFTAMGGVAPLSNTGAASGIVTLVTPVFVSTNIGSFPIVPTFGILSLQFVPEPGTFALLGAGLAACAVAARRRARD